MRWVTAVRRLLLQWLKRGRGQREARGRRRDRTALAFLPAGGSGAVCPGRRVNRTKAVLQRVAECWPGFPSHVGSHEVQPVRIVVKALRADCGAHRCVVEPSAVPCTRSLPRHSARTTAAAACATKQKC